MYVVKTTSAGHSGLQLLPSYILSLELTLHKPLAPHNQSKLSVKMPTLGYCKTAEHPLTRPKYFTLILRKYFSVQNYFRFSPVKPGTSVTLYWIRSNRDGSDNAAIEATSLDPNYRSVVFVFHDYWSHNNNHLLSQPIGGEPLNHHNSEHQCVATLLNVFENNISIYH